MRMFNRDGSEGMMCGNGIRCVAKYLYDSGIAKKPVLRIETKSGVKECSVMTMCGKAYRITVDMGAAELAPALVPVKLDGDSVINKPVVIDGHEDYITCVSMGNPHCVIQVDDVETATVETLGPVMENHERFPERANIGFMQVVSRSHIRLRVYERGAGETQACGSGACAAAAVGIQQGLLGEEVRVELPGGRLDIAWKGPGQPLYMTGPAAHVYDGFIHL